LTTLSSFGLLIHLPPCILKEDTGLTRRFRKGHLDGALSASPKRMSKPLTLLSPSIKSPAEPDTYEEPRTASPALASTRAAFPALERLPSTRTPPTFAGSVRHRSHDFAAVVRLPARVHPLRCSRRRGLDSHECAGYWPGHRENHAPRIDFCNQNDR
jgi:hypothetical protein